MFKKLTVFLLLLLFSDTAGAQHGTRDSTSRDRSAGMTAYYQGFIGDHALLYTGRAYSDYPPLEGHAYLDGPGWYVGSVTYDGIEYRNIYLKYDLVKNLVVVLRPDKQTKVSLHNRLVSRFTLSGKNFVRLQAVDHRGDSLHSFYEIVESGAITLLAKTEKTITDKIKGLQIVRPVSEKTFFHVYQEGTYYPVRNMASFLELVPQQRKEMQQELRRQKIKYRSNPRRALAAMVAHYNQTAR